MINLNTRRNKVAILATLVLFFIFGYMVLLSGTTYSGTPVDEIYTPSDIPTAGDGDGILFEFAVWELVVVAVGGIICVIIMLGMILS